MRLSLNVLLSLIFRAKKTGKGMIGNGRILIKLLEVIADSPNIDKEIDMLNKFGNDIAKPVAYKKLDRFLSRFLRTGKGYPYQIITFKEFENPQNYTDFMEQMSILCSEILDENKCENLVYTLLEIIERDNNIHEIFYGGKYVPKADFIGSYAHPKSVCLEAFILGLLHYTHKNPVEESAVNVCLSDMPERKRFRMIRYRRSENVFELNVELPLAETIKENAKYPYTTSETNHLFRVISAKNYPVHLYYGGKIIADIPRDRNVFIHGSGGIGKSTFLLNLVENNISDTTYFYFPLYKYRTILLSDYSSKSWYFLTQILLKYYYQYEYATCESCIACEGKDVFFQKLNELERLLKRTGNEFVLLLDGMNELPSDVQSQLVDELEIIVDIWENVRVIISGRNVPQYELFDNFKKFKLVGIPKKSCISALSENGIVVENEYLIELLQTPLFLNMYINSQDSTSEINTRGEILDAYVTDRERKLTKRAELKIDNCVIRFVMEYALPFAAKYMVDYRSFEISRSDLANFLDKAIECYLENEQVYLNYIAPKRMQKDVILKYMNKETIIDILVENICFLTQSTSEPHKLHFMHQYFRDYFAARHIINLLEATDIGYGKNHTEEKAKFFAKYELGSVWFYESDMDIFRLIGEICGDYKNTPCENFRYTKTILDTLLDMCREFYTFRATENVMNVMAMSRNNVICEADFSGTHLPLSIPYNIKFSMNGDYPCNFSDSVVFFLDILYCNNDEDYTHNSDIVDRITPERLASLDNFKECDFSQAQFMVSEEYADALRIMGAIVD